MGICGHTQAVCVVVLGEHDLLLGATYHSLRSTYCVTQVLREIDSAAVLYVEWFGAGQGSLKIIH